MQPIRKRNRGTTCAVTAAAVHAFAVVTGVFTAIVCGSPDAHRNPAVSLGMAITTGDYSKFWLFLVAQILGAFLGPIIVWLHFLRIGGLRRFESEARCFLTSSAIRSVGANLISEIIGTFVPVVVGCAIFPSAPHQPTPPLAWALIWLACSLGSGLSLGGTAGYAINPAGDLGTLAGAALAGILVYAVHF